MPARVNAAAMPSSRARSTWCDGLPSITLSAYTVIRAMPGSGISMPKMSLPPTARWGPTTAEIVSTFPSPF